MNKYLLSTTKTGHRIISTYHPQANGMIERFNQTLQTSLVKVINTNKTDWDEKLDGLLFAYSKRIELYVKEFMLMPKIVL